MKPDSQRYKLLYGVELDSTVSNSASATVPLELRLISWSTVKSVYVCAYACMCLSVRVYVRLYRWCLAAAELQRDSRRHDILEAI